MGCRETPALEAPPPVQPWDVSELCSPLLSPMRPGGPESRWMGRRGRPEFEGPGGDGVCEFLESVCPWRGVDFLGLPSSCGEEPPGLCQREEGALSDCWLWMVGWADSLILGTLPWERAARGGIFGTFSSLI